MNLIKKVDFQGDNTSFSQYVGNFNRLFDPTTNDTEERLKKWVSFTIVQRSTKNHLSNVTEFL